MPLRKIKQTSKTILFEEFCKESSESNANDVCSDLLVLLKGEKECDYLTKVAEKLEVNNYQEFVEKFTPCVWESFYQVDGEAYPRIQYSVERPKDNPEAKKVPLSSHEFYKMVLNLYTKKGAAGDSNYDFDYSMVGNLLAPEKILEEAKKVRKELYYNVSEYMKLDESRKTERNERASKIKDNRRAIAAKYDNNSAILKLALADVNQKLALISAPQDKGTGENPLLESTSRPCLMEFNEKGDLKMVPIAPVNDESSTSLALVSPNEPSTKIATLVTGDYDKKTGEKGNVFIRDLVKSIYAPNENQGELVSLSKDELEAKRDQYTYLYKIHQESFVNALCPVVEKMLNVKVFFDNATIDGKNLKAPLIVSNCKPEDLLDDEEVKEKFRNFLQQASNETQDKKLWFAIVPALGDPDFMEKIEGEQRIDDSLDDLDESSVSVGDLTSTATAKEMLGILKNYNIISFFNYKGSGKTGFHNLSGSVVSSYRNKLETLRSNECAVFCYPNFTILPKHETTVKIGTMRNSDGVDEDKFLDLPGIYVDASYVAAGLIVGVQDPTYLQKKEFLVNPNNPSVRFDIEDGDNRFKLQTTLNREGGTVWMSGVEEEICSGGELFGFVFTGNAKYFNGENVAHSYVYGARNMKGDSLYTTLIQNFVVQYFKLMAHGQNNSYKKEDITKFINGDAYQWALESENKQYDNSLLKKGEKIVLEENCLQIKFKAKEELVRLNVQVNDNN